MTRENKIAIITGAGPAGLTAAYELLKRTDIIPVIIEKSGEIGGISKTINYKGNRMDIGGHRFFSKSERVMEWWLNILPLQAEEDQDFPFALHYQNKTANIQQNVTHASNTQDSSKVMLIRKRLSRIYFLRKFFSYPVTLSIDTLRKLGLGTTVAILFSYLYAQLFPRRPENNLEDFMINRFGRKLYRLFFEDYTHKVWGVPCVEIPAEWGAQRIKGVSISKAAAHALKELVKRKKHTGDVFQKGTETSLIEQFLYPKYGPGQLWEEVARQVPEMGGIIYMNHNVEQVYTEGGRVTAVRAGSSKTGSSIFLKGDYFFSTMPVKELIAGMGHAVPLPVREIADNLQYRDFITVGILLKNMALKDRRTGEWKPLELKDTWIYVQERDVKVGRIQCFNNWSPHMVKDPATVWIGMEYFCNEADDFWKLPDREIAALAILELEKIGLAAAACVLDSTVLRVEKTYPAYFGSYARFDEIRSFTDQFSNLFLVGRNGMHKYNNADHSMLTAMVSVDNIIAGVKEKENIWAINTEQEYHEQKAAVLPEFTGDALPLRFKDFLFRNTWNKWALRCAGIALLLQFIIFKYLYPDAGFINGDSYSYILAAYHNLTINTYPVGYSRFLRLFSVFSSSDTALVALQYLILQGSTLAFLFTTFYFYRPGKVVTVLLLAFSVINPVWLYLANYIASDSLFYSLSIIWFTLMVWIMHRPGYRLIIAQGIIIALAFTVRYNAMYFPLLSIVAFALSKQHLMKKIAGMATGIACITAFILFNQAQYNRISGSRQFTPFTGWQTLNNAMNAYRYISPEERKPVPAAFEKLDDAVRAYFDTSRQSIDLKTANTVYMWDSTSPLRQYMEMQFSRDSSAGALKKWAGVAPMYGRYGNYLIRSYPAAYAQHYLLPNLLNYLQPPTEFLQYYSTGRDSVAQIAQLWFKYPDKTLYTRFNDLKVNTLNIYSFLYGGLNMAFILAFIFFLLLAGYRQDPVLFKALVLAAALWLTNLVFSVYASPIALRFQLFPMTVSSVFTVMVMEYIFKLAYKPDPALAAFGSRPDLLNPETA